MARVVLPEGPTFLEEVVTVRVKAPDDTIVQTRVAVGAFQTKQRSDLGLPWAAFKGQRHFSGQG